MVDELKTWEVLFQRALELIDAARGLQIPVDTWTFGGGTVLMRRHHHRLSKDVDIFIDDPQFLGYVSPRLSPTAESLTSDYAEDQNHVKLRFPEGEIDFIASPPLTAKPANTEIVLERPFLVETSAEILAKKVWHRGPEFTARDIFDFALIAEREPEALKEIAEILRARRTAILSRIEGHSAQLREAFDSLIVLDYHRSFDECVEVVKEALARASADAAQ